MLDEVLGAGIVTLEKLDMAFADVAPGKCAMAIMGKSGDFKIIWDKTITEEVEAARRAFAELKAQGYAAFAVKGENGEKDVQLHEFNPNAERVILSPALVGG